MKQQSGATMKRAKTTKKVKAAAVHQRTTRSSTSQQNETTISPPNHVGTSTTRNNARGLASKSANLGTTSRNGTKSPPNIGTTARTNSKSPTKHKSPRTTTMPTENKKRERGPNLSGLEIDHLLKSISDMPRVGKTVDWDEVATKHAERFKNKHRAPITLKRKFEFLCYHQGDTDDSQLKLYIQQAKSLRFNQGQTMEAPSNEDPEPAIMHFATTPLSTESNIATAAVDNLVPNTNQPTRTNPDETNFTQFLKWFTIQQQQESARREEADRKKDEEYRRQRDEEKQEVERKRQEDNERFGRMFESLTTAVNKLANFTQPQASKKAPPETKNVVYVAEQKPASRLFDVDTIVRMVKQKSAMDQIRNVLAQLEDKATNEENDGSNNSRKPEAEVNASLNSEKKEADKNNND